MNQATSAETVHGMPEKEFLQKVKRALESGDRVELIPVKDNVRIIHVRRQEIK